MRRYPTDAIVDSGAQAERTRLAWNRTGLALAGNAALLVHAVNGTFVRHLPALMMLAVALGCFMFSGHRYHAINSALRSGRPVAHVVHVRALACLSLLPALIALTGALV